VTLAFPVLAGRNQTTGLSPHHFVESIPKCSPPDISLTT
jgi:hypothetical protein